MIKIILLALLTLSGCQKFTRMMESGYSDKINIKNGSDHIKIVFSHNINGETHPCGCRKFPLGGLPQVAGYFEKAKKESSIFYVDTGDLLFQTTAIPPYYKKSMSFTAKKLAQVQSKLKLDLFVPGELDFSLGIDFLNDVLTKNKLNVLVSNFSKDVKVPHKKWTKLKVDKRSLYFIGVVNPNIMDSNSKMFFIDPLDSIRSSLKEISNEASKNKTIILLSHGGMDFDRRVAQTFSEINWIIGSHSQAFLRDPEVENNTKIVQVLSRNHYLGVLKVPLSTEGKITYEQVEVRDELKNEIENNPYSKWLDEYKTELDKIQAAEQKEFGTTITYNDIKGPTYKACTDCHTAQVDFWNKTAHSIAYYTLIQAKASNNPSCVGCHSVFLNKANGFTNKDDIIQGEELTEEKMKQYWSELNVQFKGTGSIRELAEDKRAKLAHSWQELDNKHGVEHNFANVQCLNCHNQNHDHPFGEKVEPIKDYTAMCIKCHTADQSPSWYEEKKEGLATKLKKKYVEQKIKEVACPKLE